MRGVGLGLWDGSVKSCHLRDRSCRLRCSLLLNARLQNWHLYFLSGASEAFREAGVDEAEVVGRASTLAPGMLIDVSRCSCLEGRSCHKEYLVIVDGDGGKRDKKMTTALGSLLDSPQNDS